MPKPKITNLKYSYKRTDTDLWVLNEDDVPIDKNLIHDQQIVHFSPQTFGGNHKHPRIEWFIGIGDLTFWWLDEDGKKHEEHMNPEGQLVLIEVPSYLPHAVVNNSVTKNAVMFEYADAKMSNVEEIVIVKNL